MKVTFRTTLGSRDATECGRECGEVIDHAACAIGAELDVNEKTAAWLSARGLIEETAPVEKEKPAELKAVPVKPVIGKAKDTTTKTDV